jgi:hypothetical protein
MQISNLDPLSIDHYNLTWDWNIHLVKVVKVDFPASAPFSAITSLKHLACSTKSLSKPRFALLPSSGPLAWV